MPKIMPGEKIPDFQLNMAFGQETELYELLKEKSIQSCGALDIWDVHSAAMISGKSQRITAPLQNMTLRWP